MDCKALLGHYVLWKPSGIQSDFSLMNSRGYIKPKRWPEGLVGILLLAGLLLIPLSPLNSLVRLRVGKILSFLLLEIGALMNLKMMIMLPFSFYFQVIYLRLWLSSPYFSHLTKYGDYLTKLNTLESVFYTWTWFPCLAKPPIRSLVLF